MVSTTPEFSVIMPTFNSEGTIEKSLQSVRGQDYDQNEVEILVIDGSSSDNTLAIANKYDVKILNNQKRQQEYAKSIGIEKAKGKYLVFLDSDEVMENTKAFSNRETIFNKEPKVKIVHASGYKKPQEASAINYYINYFSDPFTYFMQKTSSAHTELIKKWTSSYNVVSRNEIYTVFDLKSTNQLPVVDMCAGNTVEAKYIKTELIKNGGIENNVPRIFYIVVKSGGLIAMLSDDPVIHYSADTVKKFLAKIRWRVIVNTHYRAIPGTGFSNREDFQPRIIKLKKYLFIPYAFSLVIPLMDAFSVFIKCKNPVSFLHVPIAVYAAGFIVYQKCLNLLDVHPALRAYGKKNKLNEND